MSHRNAALTPRRRLKVARLVVEDGWPVSEVAARFQVSWPPVKRWADRHLASEPMHDRSSRPETSPSKTSKAVTKRCVSLRIRLREGPIQLATRLGIAVRLPVRWRCPSRPAEGGRLVHFRQHPQRYPLAPVGSPVVGPAKHAGRGTPLACAMRSPCPGPWLDAPTRGHSRPATSGTRSIVSASAQVAGGRKERAGCSRLLLRRNGDASPRQHPAAS